MLNKFNIIFYVILNLFNSVKEMIKDISEQTQLKSKSFRPNPIQYDDGLETNLYEIAEQVCSRSPQLPCTIQLVMDHDIPSDSDLNDFEYNLLKTFTLSCIDILFGENINPFKLSEQNLQLLQEYINSIGYTLTTEIQETELSKKFVMSFRRFVSRDPKEPNPLAHLKKYMHSQSK